MPHCESNESAASAAAVSQGAFGSAKRSGASTVYIWMPESGSGRLGVLTHVNAQSPSVNAQGHSVLFGNRGVSTPKGVVVWVVQGVYRWSLAVFQTPFECPMYRPG